MDRERTRASRPEVYRAWDENEEAAFVAQTMRGLRGEGARLPTTWRCSTAPTPSPACWRTRSAAAGIPYLIVGGVRFYERREIKDVVAYLRLVVEPARRRRLPPRGRPRPRAASGKATLDRLDDGGARGRACRCSRACAAIARRHHRQAAPRARGVRAR